jgi:hypothetical protein
MAASSESGAGIAGYVAATREVCAGHPFRAPAILGKAAIGRALFGLGPDVFFLLDLQNRPVAGWRHYVPLYPNFSKALKLINWQSADPGLARDKVATSERCAAAGVAVAPIFLILGRDTAAHPVGSEFRATSSADEAIAALDGPDAPEALFIKPAADFGGQGLMRAERSSGGWRVEGEAIATRTLVERLLAASDPWGTMVQPVLRNHRAMDAIGGRLGLNTVRMIVALTDEGPTVVCAALKLLGREGLADNFSGGQTGNLVAAVDLDSGRLNRAYGYKAGRRYVLDRFDAHPATGERLTGFRLPDWAACLDLGRRIAPVFPESPLLGLDIALTDDGPLLIEKNMHWNTAIPQLACGEGLRAVFRRLLPRLRTSDEVRARAFALMGERA